MNPLDADSVDRTAIRRSSSSYVRFLWLIALVLSGVAAAIRVWRLSIATDSWDVVGLIYDDAYYYLTVAANTVDTGRSTLDGSTLTNGYQPLWFVMVAILGWVIGTDAWRFFSGFVLLICAILVFSVLLGAPFRESERNVVRASLAVGIAVAAVLWANIFLSGMETILLLPLAIPLVVLMEAKLTRRNAIALSGIFALAFLVRLDMLVIIPAFIVVALLVEWRVYRRHGESQEARNSWRVLPWLSVIVVPVIVAYAVVNQVIYGTPVPVSGLAKGIGPSFENWGVVRGYFNTVMGSRPFILIVLVLIVLEGFAYRAGIRSSLFLRSLAITVLACCMQGMYYAVASTWNVWFWYYYFIGLFLILVIARIVLLGGELWSHNLRMSGAGLFAIIVVTLLHLTQIDVRNTMVEPDPPPPPLGVNASLLDTGRVFTYNQISLIMLRDFFSTTGGRMSRIAMGDRSGGLSYWGRDTVKVVHTEGLLLGYSYIQARRAGTASEYLANDKNIDYFVVDRDRLSPSRRADGGLVYVIADPIQALKTDRDYHVALFCFPNEAIRYRMTYERGTGPSDRIAFAFGQRVACTSDEQALIADAIANSRLREISLPNEYKH